MFPEGSDERGVFWGFLPQKRLDLQKLFHKLSATFGQPDITDELVIFFQYSGDFRIRITNTSLKFLLKTRTAGQWLTKEIVTKIPLEEAETFIRLISAMGYKQGLYSLGTKYTYSKNQISFIIRMNPNFGDFFQIKKTIEGEDFTEDVKVTLTNFLKELGLGGWSDKEYERHIEEVWKDKLHEPLLDEQYNLNKKIRDILIQYQYSVKSNFVSENESIYDILKRTSNDYTELEKAFLNFTAHELVSADLINYSNSFNVSASIIIPYFNNLPFLIKCIKSISLQNLTPTQFKSLEVIVVDDGSDSRESEFVLQHSISELNSKGVKFQFIRMSENQGRAFARNLGASAAKNEVLIFLDSDTLIENNYIKETLVRHQYLDNIVLVGLKQNIIFNINQDIADLVCKKPDFENDFRYNHFCKKDWDGLYPVTDERLMSCIEETNKFKDFGFGKVLGPYDLPCMVVTNNVSLKKKYFDMVGGFNNHFSKVWGYEDTFLGACLIATGNFVLPLLSTGAYHLVTESEHESGVKAEKKSQLTRNFLVYKDLINKRGYLKHQK